MFWTALGATATFDSASVQSTDWPQMLGPSRNGVYAGPRLADTWGPDGPPVVWRKAVGHGLSGPVVVGDRVLLFQRVGNREVLEAMDARTGRTEWRYDYPTTYRDDFGFDDGPRAVPVVSDGVVYTYGAEGQLHAVDLDTGKALWHVDAMAHYRAPKNFFGAGGSPIVEDGRVIANVGGADAGIVALDARTGRELWTSTTDGASYSSGVTTTVAGRRLAMLFTRAGIVGLAPETGEVVLQRAWRSRSASSVNAASPLIVGDRLFISAEYGPGAAVFRLGDGEMTEVWASNDVLSTHYATSVHRDGILYGYHGRQEFGPSLRAVEMATGTVRWNVDQFRAGSITIAGDRLVLMRESGELVIAEATPDAFRPLAAAQVLPPTVRALPAIAGGYLYVRNGDTLLSLDLRREDLAQSPRQVLDQAMADFRAGRITESIAGFDRVAALQPDAAPQLWQRGIALFYAGRYDACRQQFESHRTVNPSDVENAVWHFLCVARAESPAVARTKMLPVGPDGRVPMREIEQMFRGALQPDAVLAAGTSSASAEFYAHLYVGLYLEATGQPARGRQEIRLAAADRYAAAGGYMHDVARVHLAVQRSGHNAYRPVRLDDGPTRVGSIVKH